MGRSHDCHMTAITDSLDNMSITHEVSKLFKILSSHPHSPSHTLTHIPTPTPTHTPPASVRAQMHSLAQTHPHEALQGITDFFGVTSFENGKTVPLRS